MTFPITGDDVKRCAECGELAASTRGRINNGLDGHGTAFIDWEDP